MEHIVFCEDNLDVMQHCIDDEEVDLVYIDPPFNTGKVQKRVQIKVTADEEGDRIGFQDERYKTLSKSNAIAYSDIFDNLDFYLGFLRSRFEDIYRILKPYGSFFFHIDYRAVHYCKVLLDEIFGIKCFQNEIIWAYDFGARSKKKWSTKHDTILWYTKHPKIYTFNYDEMDRIPYMAPGLVGEEKARKGKTPTDVWWHTIVPTNGKEKTGYPTQKPLGIIERIVKVHSNPGDLLLDCFAGSGTLSESAARNERSSIAIDENPEAIEIILERLEKYNVTYVEDYKSRAIE